MPPILLFESTWKVMWLVAVALPLWLRGDMDPDTAMVANAALWVVIVLAVVPWRYVFDQYVRTSGDQWRREQRNGAPVDSPTSLLRRVTQTRGTASAATIVDESTMSGNIMSPTAAP